MSERTSNTATRPISSGCWSIPALGAAVQDGQRRQSHVVGDAASNAPQHPSQRGHVAENGVGPGFSQPLRKAMAAGGGVRVVHRQGRQAQGRSTHSWAM